MSLEFAVGWNVQKSQYVAQHGPYQQLLDLLTEKDVKSALKIAMIVYLEGAAGDALRAANDPNGERVVVEQGAHQIEAIKDQPARSDVKAFDFVKDKTMHFTLRHYCSGGPNKAFHCYLSQNVRKQWGVTSISYFQNGVGLQMSQTAGRDFMSMLAKRFIMAHGRDDD